MRPRTFHTTDTTLLDRNDQPVEVIGVTRRPDKDHDAEVLPMYRLRFADGEEIEAWRDEIRPWYGRGVMHTVNVESVPDTEKGASA